MNARSELSSFLKYELAPRTPSLFDDVSMRNSTMALPATLLDSMVPSENYLPDGALFVEMLDIFFMRCNMATPDNIR